MRAGRTDAYPEHVHRALLQLLPDVPHQGLRRSGGRLLREAPGHIYRRVRRLTLAQVRRAHIAAQGLAEPRPTTPPDIRHLRKAMKTMAVLQIDSVNVVERAHQLTLFSRIGPYDRTLLWRAMQQRELFEYWTHMASFVPIDDFPLWKHRMEHHQQHPWPRIHELRERAPGMSSRSCSR